MFTLLSLAAAGVILFLVGVLVGRRSDKANAYADELYARAKAAEAKIEELKQKYGV